MDVMLDLETLSVRSDAAIVVIGAIKFNRSSDLVDLDKMDTFYKLITIKSCKELKFRIDKETLAWWDNQKEDVKYEALENPNRIPLKQALQEFSNWMKPCEIIWGNGDDFDCTILGEAYNKCNIEIPWKFWNTRDLRTVMDLAKLKKSDFPKDKDQEHHALKDCYRQITYLKKALKKLNLN